MFESEVMTRSGSSGSIVVFFPISSSAHLAKRQRRINMETTVITKGRMQA